MADAFSGRKAAPRRSRRAEPEPLRKAAEQLRAVGLLIGPHSTRDARELRELDRQLSTFARERPRIVVAAVQPGGGATTVSRLIDRTMGARLPSAGATVQDLGAGRLVLEHVTALCVVTKADLAALPATRDFLATLAEHWRFAFPGRVVVVVNQLRPPELTPAELKLAIAVRDLRRTGLPVISLAHDPALAHARAEHVRWAPRTELAALRLGAAVLTGGGQ